MNEPTSTKKNQKRTAPQQQHQQLVNIREEIRKSPLFIPPKTTTSSSFPPPSSSKVSKAASTTSIDAKSNRPIVTLNDDQNPQLVNQERKNSLRKNGMRASTSEDTSSSSPTSEQSSPKSAATVDEAPTVRRLRNNTTASSSFQSRANTLSRRSILQFFTRPKDKDTASDDGSSVQRLSGPVDLCFSELDGDEIDVLIGSRNISQLKSILLSDKKFGYLTLDQFLEFGLRYAFNHESFINVFTTTYKSFMTPKQVVPILEKVLKSITMPDTELSQAKKEKQNRMVQRAANFIKVWVEKCQTDFMFDKNIVENMFSFIGSLNNYGCHAEDYVDNDSTFEVTQNKVFDLAQFVSKVITDLEDKSKGIVDANEQEAKKKKMPKPYLLSRVPKDPRLIKFEEINPVEIARQLTLVEFSMFSKVTNEELLGLGWMKDSKEWTAPNITEIISRSNLMSDWVSTMILQQESMKDRSKILKHFVLVADACYKLNNFNTLFEITMSLVSNPVYRLKQTWESIGSTERQRFKKLEDICSFQGSRKNYREELKKVPPNQSCLPYLGVSLTDLVFFEEGNKSTKNTTEKEANVSRKQEEETKSLASATMVEDETVRSYINFTKRSLMAGVVSQLMEYKSRPYELHPVEYMQQFLYFSMNSNIIQSEDELEKLSRQREAPQRK